MASQFDPREPATEKSRSNNPCSNAPNQCTLRTSQTLHAKAEILPRMLRSTEPAPRMVKLFSCIQARYG